MNLQAFLDASVVNQETRMIAEKKKRKKHVRIIYRQNREGGGEIKDVNQLGRTRKIANKPEKKEENGETC